MSAAVEISRSHNDNFTQLNLGKNVTIWFSYETPVAFAVSGRGRIKSKNIWSQTTKKHLNSLAATEVEHSEFTEQLSKLMDTIGAAVQAIE